MRRRTMERGVEAEGGREGAGREARASDKEIRPSTRCPDEGAEEDGTAGEGEEEPEEREGSPHREVETGVMAEEGRVRGREVEGATIEGETTGACGGGGEEGGNAESERSHRKGEITTGLGRSDKERGEGAGEDALLRLG